jgi:hypothetical protein
MMRSAGSGAMVSEHNVSMTMCLLTDSLRIDSRDYDLILAKRTQKGQRMSRDRCARRERAPRTCGVKEEGTENNRLICSIEIGFCILETNCYTNCLRLSVPRCLFL